MKQKSGDFIRIKTEGKEYDGILMPRPDILEGEYTILKLESGYNVGIENSKITKIDVLKPYARKETFPAKMEKKKDLPTISILSFGGTISSKVDYRTGGTYADYTAEDFVAMMPELTEVANLNARKVMNLMSEDMNPKDWKVMAKSIAEELNKKDVDGVVVTQGTDTLHYSSAAMSFFLKHLTKPVVFTAAQRSIDRGSSDAFMNLLCSVHAAKSELAEVMICMHASSNDDKCLLIRGSKTRKMHVSRRDAFRPINDEPLGEVFPDGKLHVFNPHHRKRRDGNVEIHPYFEQKTGLVYVYPGMDPDVLDFYLAKKYKGLVIAGTGLGHVPTLHEEYSLMKKLEELEKTCMIVITSQAIYGRVHPSVYASSRKLSMQLEGVFAEDMTPETAYVKLGWVLGQEKEKEKIKELFLDNIAGEITARTTTKFLN